LNTFSEAATQEDPVGEGVRRGRAEIAEFWDRAVESYDEIELRARSLHVVGSEAALEWTIVARDRDEWVVFDGVDTFSFEAGPLISSVRAYWQREGRHRTRTRPSPEVTGGRTSPS
jgi:steroid delta-isomerase